MIFEHGIPKVITVIIKHKLTSIFSFLAVYVTVVQAHAYIHIYSLVQVH